jgi:hypothetical protein
MTFYKVIIVLNWTHLEDEIPKVCHETFENKIYVVPFSSRY